MKLRYRRFTELGKSTLFRRHKGGAEVANYPFARLSRTRPSSPCRTSVWSFNAEIRPQKRFPQSSRSSTSPASSRARAKRGPWHKVSLPHRERDAIVQSCAALRTKKCSRRATIGPQARHRTSRWNSSTRTWTTLARLVERVRKIGRRATRRRRRLL